MPASLEWTFAYGSNMHVDALRAWFVTKGHREARIERCVPAKLAGYRLVWNFYSRSRRGGAANVERDASSILPGVALLVNAPGLAAIDEKEGHPRVYSRGESTVRVQLEDGTCVEAWVYAVVREKCQPTIVPPTREYLDTMIAAASHFGLPTEYIATLRSTRTKEAADG